MQTRSALQSEDEVKAAVAQHLEERGWTVNVAWGRQRGVNIRADRQSQQLLIEAKGEAANPPQQVNYFLNALGELVQRMSEPAARYGLALPDHPQYRGLVRRLPDATWTRLNLFVLFVDRNDRSTVTASDNLGADRGLDR